MSCPTCFRQIHVPQSRQDSGSKLLLTTSEVTQRPQSALPANGLPGPRRSNPLPAIIGVLLVVGLAAAAFGFRDRWIHFLLGDHPKPAGEASGEGTSNRPAIAAVPDTNWTLSLAERVIPDEPVAGRIQGQPFTLSRVTVQAGTLTFRQGPKWPPELGLTLQLFARQAEDLAGQNVVIEATRTNPPKLTLRWKDEHDKAVNHPVSQSYAVRIEFGKVEANQLPGRIYLCAADDAKSWIAGTFRADIKKPPAPKPLGKGPAPPPKAYKSP